MRPAAKLLLLLVLAANTFILAARAAAGASCIPHERDALLTFKRGISSDPMNMLASWQKEDGHGDCCRWRGVRCSNHTGHVLKLQLRNAHVTSSNFEYEDVFSSAALVGQISHSLLSMDHLVYLDLSMNYLNGSSSHIPAFLGSFTKLRYLNLSGIPFSGRVPPHLGNLSKLQHLDLSWGQILCSTDISWLAGLSKLEYLDMSMVNLSTIVDWAHVVNMIPSLKVLIFSKCSLRSANQSPPRVNLTYLERLDLSDNIFDHTMASSWLWNLTVLQYLKLAGTNLYGEVPVALGEITSLRVLDLSYSKNMGIMTSLKKLCNLTIIDLTECNLYGNIKELIGLLPQCSLNKLLELYLGFNNITGTMPGQMAHLTSLVVLDISNNHLTGAIPREVGQFASLSTLSLSGNNLSGYLPSEIGTLANLVNLVLSANKLSGPIPSEIGMLVSLSTLYLSSNNLFGHVPYEIGMLANLTVLFLGFNKLNGDITEKHFARLAKLKRLNLSSNSLKIRVSSEWLPPFSLDAPELAYCEIGPMFPVWLQFQVNMNYVDISNTGIIDKLPNWFSATFSNAFYLDMSHNQIKGRLPKNMEFMSLEYLYLSSNQLTGEIPSLPRNISILDLSLNSLSGNLPSHFGTPQLVFLNLFSNHITGGLSGSICELQNLFELNLGNNLFKGEIPRCFPARNLGFLLLKNNSFSGDFPLFLKNCKQMVFLDLSQNKFSGKLPQWIGGLIELRFLRLSQNMFSRNIPTSITNLTHLHHLNLASNRLSGVIPCDISSLIAMTGKYVKGLDLDEEPYGAHQTMIYEVRDYFSVTTKGQELYYDVRIFKMVSIDLSFNHLSGGIPEGLSSLDALLNLDLSNNHLSGDVPANIGVMKSLESLDLSSNMLSGGIPSSLSNLSYLSYLDLSDNNLTGRVPSGQQLDTLYAEHPSMYTGNSGLCGPPLQKMCPGNNASRQHVQNSDEHGFEPMSFYFGLGLGFMLGLWVVFCLLLSKKAWKIASFRLIDSISDQIYVFVIVTWKSLTREGSTD